MSQYWQTVAEVECVGRL